MHVEHDARSDDYALNFGLSSPGTPAATPTSIRSLHHPKADDSYQPLFSRIKEAFRLQGYALNDKSDSIRPTPTIHNALDATRKHGDVSLPHRAKDQSFGTCSLVLQLRFANLLDDPNSFLHPLPHPLPTICKYPKSTVSCNSEPRHHFLNRCFRRCVTGSRLEHARSHSSRRLPQTHVGDELFRCSACPLRRPQRASGCSTTTREPGRPATGPYLPIENIAPRCFRSSGRSGVHEAAI
jgi:hypothetical protein